MGGEQEKAKQKACSFYYKENRCYNNTITLQVWIVVAGNDCTALGKCLVTEGMYVQTLGEQLLFSGTDMQASGSHLVASGKQFLFLGK